MGETISLRYWSALTRRMDPAHLDQVLDDPKGDGVRRLYLPLADERSRAYYGGLTRSHDFELHLLPPRLTPQDVLGLNRAPGLLGLGLDREGQPRRYVVPGGRFNEMYGWDSYFIALGLVADGRLSLAGEMFEQLLYQIEHYGAILNANRTYYLTRSQPPFLTSYLRLLLEHGWSGLDLPRALRCAMIEYQDVWIAPKRRRDCGLSRYYCCGVGYPPETMIRHYATVMEPFARAEGMDIEEFRQAYLERRVAPPELDLYFREDRAVRESGHDTSYRLEENATGLCTVDLNSLLYRYEVDLAELLSSTGPLDGFPGPEVWRERARERARRMSEFCWEPGRGFFDYDWRLQRRTGFESATNLYPLWAGLATREQAEIMVERVLPGLREGGGVASGSAASRGELHAGRTARQWDFPYGWAPHQMLLWQGLLDYQCADLARDLAWRWTSMLARCACEDHGTLAEKYDVVQQTHRVNVEYPNQGVDGDAAGFGWTNASYQVGRELLEPAQRQVLGRLERPDVSSCLPRGGRA